MSAMRLTLTSALTLLCCVILSTCLLSANASPDTVPFIPTSKRIHADNWHQTSIRSLIYARLERRQQYTCTAPNVPCLNQFCCQDYSWHCCMDGSCCDPNYYCAIASNGIIGCCPDGELCSGPVDDPTVVTDTPTTTRISTPTLDTTDSTPGVPPVARPTTTSDDFPPLFTTVHAPVGNFTTTPASVPHLVSTAIQFVLPSYAIGALGAIMITVFSL